MASLGSALRLGWATGGLRPERHGVAGRRKQDKPVKAVKKMGLRLVQSCVEEGGCRVPSRLFPQQSTLSSLPLLRGRGALLTPWRSAAGPSPAPSNRDDPTNEPHGRGGTLSAFEYVGRACPD